MSLIESTKLLLREHRILPNKFLGQNFMIDASIFESMSEYAHLTEKDVVLDIGAGLGFLTRFLALRCREVIAVENDIRLVRILGEQLKDLLNITLISGNVFGTQIPKFNKVISIPPYQISSRLVQWLFNSDFDCAVLIFQREFAKRLVAPVASEDYGWLTVLTYYCATAEILEEVPRQSFYPQPEVESIVLRLEPKSPPPFILKSEDSFVGLLRSLFAQRNRKLSNAVSSFIRGAQKTADTIVNLPLGDKRVRELAPEDFGALANVLCN